MHASMHANLLQLGPTLCNPMDLNWTQLGFVQRWLDVLKRSWGSRQGQWKALCRVRGKLERPGKCKCPSGLQRDWETQVLSFLLITFQRNGFQVLDKDSVLSYRRYIYISNGQRKNSQILSPILVNAVRKGSKGPICQVLARTNSKSFWQPGAP